MTDALFALPETEAAEAWVDALGEAVEALDRALAVVPPAKLPAALITRAERSRTDIRNAITLTRVP